MTESRKLHVFLCHSSQDKPVVRELYQRFIAEGWVDPWLDEEMLLPGQDWDIEIERAVEAADAVVVFLSNNSVTKEGYVQRELKFVLDIALEKPEGTIFVIPLRLDDCTLPRRLRTWQYVDYFPAGQRNRAYQKLLQSLSVRHGQLLPKEDSDEKSTPLETESFVKDSEKKTSPSTDKLNYPSPLPLNPMGLLDLSGLILPIIYFILAGLYRFGYESREMRFVWAVTAILAGIVFLLKRQIASGVPLKISMILFLMVHGLVAYTNYTGVMNSSPIPPILEGLLALVVAGVLVISLRSPRKAAPYSSIVLAVFLFLVGIKLFLDILDYFPTQIYTPLIITSIVASVLLWLEV